MKGYYKIAAAEMEVMEILWERADKVPTSELLTLVETRGRTWKRQTLNTVIVRMEVKGLVIRERGYVAAALTESELMQRQSIQILDEFYDGELKNFCTALFGKSKDMEDQINRLVNAVNILMSDEI